MVEHQPLALELQAGDGVGAERGEDHRQRRGDQRDAERVDQRPLELVVLEHGAVVVERRLLGQELRAARGGLRDRLQGQRHDPGDRQQAPQQDQDEADDRADLGLAPSSALPSGRGEVDLEQLHQHERDQQHRQEQQHRQGRTEAELELLDDLAVGEERHRRRCSARRGSSRRCCRRSGTRRGPGRARRP